MVLVDAAHRHRGIASQLVDACVASLREAGRIAGARRDAGRCRRVREDRLRRRVRVRALGGRGAATIAATGARERHRGGAVAGRDTDRRSTASACGVDRALLLRSFLARPATRAWLAPRGDGFALRRAGRRAAQVGPIVAADDAAALELLGLALDGIAGRVFIDVPVHRTSIADALTRRGFVRQRPFVRMALGDARAAAARERVFALAGPEFG